MVVSVSRIDDRHDRPIDCGPACDIARTDVVGGRGVSTRLADELGLRPAVGLVAMPTLRTGPRRVPWVHQDEGDPGNLALVRHERAELKERPSAVSRALALPNRYPVANPLEVFEGDGATGVFGLRDDALADGVVDVGAEAGLPTREPFQVALGRRSAGLLECAPEVQDAH